MAVLKFLYKDKQKNIRFLLHFALEFRLLPETIAELFGIPKDEINNFLFRNGVSHDGFSYMMNYELPDQEKAKASAKLFYAKIVHFKKNGEIEKINELLSTLYDGNIKPIVKRVDTCEKNFWTDADIEAIARYQLKYSYSISNILNIFKMYEGTYYKRVVPCFESDPELWVRYDRLMDLMPGYGGRK